MGTGRLIIMLAVFVLNFIGTIFLENKLQQYASLEITIIVAGILLSIVALIGIATDARWAWSFTTVLFSLSLANAIFLQVNVGAFVTFVLLLLVNVFGMLIAVLSIEDVEEAVNQWTAPDPTTAVPLETYAAEPEAQVSYKNAVAGTKKAGRKKR